MRGLLICKGNHVEIAGAPEVIQILPLGRVSSQKGMFNVDAESFAAMKRQFEARGLDLVIDYEHQTLKGVQAPAAGWVKELLLTADGIAARVEWTEAARRYLENREYRYLSPVISVRKSDNKATELHSMALTNTPAIDGMRPIVNSLDYEEGDDTMDLLQELAALLGLGEDVAPEQILEAIKTALGDTAAMKAAAGEREKVVANKAVCELLGLTANAPAEDVTAKIMELKAATTGSFDAKAEVLALKAQLADRNAEESVVLALKAGKLCAAQKDWAKDYALKDPAGFTAFMAKAPQVVPMGEVNYGSKALKADAPDEATLLVCKQLGVSAEDITKFGREG